MLLTFYLLFIGLHVSEGCTLENRGEVLNIAAHAGGSVLLPCYCTDQHTTPERFSWKKDNKDTWEEISIESGQYRDRVQLFNGHSPGNVSLLISHLTEEDGGDYQCSVEGAHLIIRLTVKGCPLENRGEVLNITAHTGGSVLLPCYCTDLHTKVKTFRWKKQNRSTHKQEEISSESGQYRDRVQMFNGHSPGNLSLLISHLTEEDGGDYICAVKGSRLTIKLTVKGCPLENRGEVLNITAHAGGSALLPCYCPDLHTKVKTFRWKKQNRSTHKQEEISSESGQYRDRVQVFNGHSPGNLSLLISHLTEEDGGDYICAVKGSRLTIILTVKGCPLENRGEVLNITAHAGQSVLLPCYCTDQHITPETFSWKKDNKDTWEVISSGSVSTETEFSWLMVTLQETSLYSYHTWLKRMEEIISALLKVLI
uniref:Ig-like domain-containing protein n=1 Tax=Pygocentrus nattereri TaxID=42514 RepID=A0AAR2LFT7_PYGNA